MQYIVQLRPTTGALPLGNFRNIQL